MTLSEKVAAAVDGTLKPSEVYVEILIEQELLDNAVTRLKDLVLQELEAYPEKEVKLHGLTFQKKAAAGKWDYSVIPQWNALKEKTKSLEAMAQQKFKAAEKGQLMNVADENGEEIPTPNYTAGKQTFAVLKK